MRPNEPHLPPYGGKAEAHEHKAEKPDTKGYTLKFHLNKVQNQAKHIYSVRSQARSHPWKGK